MAKPVASDSDLVLENRHVLIIFLGVALLCGVFFALGYVVGRNTSPPVVAAAPTDVEITHSAEKPSSLPSPSYIPSSASSSSLASEPAAEGTDLNLEQTSPPAADSAAGSQSAGEQGSAASSAPSPASASALPAVQPPPPGILVQVSALSRREDAEGLVDLLKEKKLPVLVTSSPQDSLFHVVVGPYNDDKEAAQVKAKLEMEGFRPFIRRQ